MTVIRTLDRIKDDLCAVLEHRASPDDVVEMDASIMVMDFPVEDCECCGTEAHTHRDTAVGLYVSVMCPEFGANSHSTCYLTIPLDLLAEQEGVNQVGNDVWDRLQSNRMLTGLEHEASEEFEDEDQEPLTD